MGTKGMSISPQTTTTGSDELRSRKIAEVPFCDKCVHVVDFGPYVQTPAGMLASRVKYHDGKPFCDNNCPHAKLRAQLLEQAYNTQLSQRNVA